jgi:hypothetical protein
MYNSDVSCSVAVDCIDCVRVYWHVYASVEIVNNSV